MTRVNIQDVAKAAKVSKSTVSRVLSGNYEYMREETRIRVDQAIQELNFRPSSVARSMTSKRTHTAAMLISDVANPFYAEVIHGVESQAFENGYDIFLCNTNYDADRGLAFIKSLIDKRVDGVLIMSSSMSDEWLTELTNNNIPLVSLDWAVKQSSKNVNTIKVEYDPGIKEAVNHLYNLGHRQFAHISGPLSLPTSQARRDSFLKALSQHEISEKDVIVVEGNLEIGGGREAALRILNNAKMPTAIFAANDMTAIGAVTEFKSRGIRIPEDISIVGLDDIWLAKETEPPLTTVALPSREIGELAMRLLLNSLANEEDGKGFLSASEVIQTALVIRKSTTKPIYT
jgi:DNA-binding LacI/PurR family transcriptional regulator